MTEILAEAFEGSGEFAEWLTTLSNAERNKIISTMALHKYFFWADHMRGLLVNLVKENPFKQVGEILNKQSSPQDAHAKLAMIATLGYPYMPYFYSGLHVVIEGWKDLGLTDPKIDALLTSSNVDLLRRFRNGSFHYQKDFFDIRFMDFLISTDSDSWIKELRDELSRWFLDFQSATKARAVEHQPKKES